MWYGTKIYMNVKRRLLSSRASRRRTNTLNNNGTINDPTQFLIVGYSTKASPSNDFVEPPRCPTRGHEMVLSDYEEEPYDFGYFCNCCGDKAQRNGLKQRWFCLECQDDYCLHCFDDARPSSLPKSIESGRIAAAGNIRNGANQLAFLPRPNERYFLWIPRTNHTTITLWGLSVVSLVHNHPSDNEQLTT